MCQIFPEISGVFKHPKQPSIVTAVVTSCTTDLHVGLHALYGTSLIITITQGASRAHLPLSVEKWRLTNRHVGI